jgi:tetratricopeptide (TPR) repeat protein/tRNA A-37 threonylcarbamoyl transferase component Bud32/TolB-like protein
MIPTKGNSVSGLVGSKLGRYEVVGIIGAGGMGEVYRARDTELGRDVAIKVISDQVAQKKRTIERFEREAKIVAQLSHPNILDIHDFGRENGVVFAVTEYLEGSDLRERTRGKMLPLSKVLEITIAVANGLSAAHSKGIIHRDIKPENIFVTSTGLIKILDFGIAGLRSRPAVDIADPEATTQSLTGTGNVVGTVGYMSPEQVRGDSVDSKSDIFALGCLLYELLTGRRAFQCDTPRETMNAILDQDPEPISELRPDVAPALEMLVGRCLQKQPDERFESARDVAFSLQTLTGARKALSGAHPNATGFTSTRRRALILVPIALALSAAVVWFGVDPFREPPDLPDEIRLGLVPFEMTESDPSLANFGAGLGLSLLEDLALVAQQEQGIDWIVPFERTQLGGATTAAKLGRDFGATIAVTGRLEKFKESVRLTISLLHPPTGKELRTTVIEDIPSNVEAFQHGPALRVAEMLGIGITQETQYRIDASATTTTSVFDLYTRSRGALSVAEEPEEVEAVAALIEGVVAEDPLFAGGWVLRAKCRLRLFESTGEQVWLERGLDDVARAIDLDGRPEEAWRAAAGLHLAAENPDEAAVALQSGILSAPRDPELRLQLAEVYKNAERFDDAEAQIQKAIYLRPDYWVGYDELAWLLLSQGDLESAAVEFGHIIDCVPEYAPGYVKVAGVYMYLERPEAALPLLERSLTIEPTSYALTNLGSIHFDASRFAQAAEYYRASIDLQSDDSFLWGNLGYAYRFGVEPEKADEAFLRAVELAEARLIEMPDDLQLAATLAGYYAMLDERERGLGLLESVVATDPTSPMILSLVAEVFEDLGDRERALEWVARSFDSGVSPIRFEGRPTLSKLVADERYQALVSKETGAS